MEFVDTPEPDPAAEFSIETAWVDCAGRTRTWNIRYPSGAKLAEISTKSGAMQIIAILNSVLRSERQRPGDAALLIHDCDPQ